MATIDADKLAAITEETKALNKAMNHVYNSLVFSCQKRCLSSSLGTPRVEGQPLISQGESVCLRRCADEAMFLDNMLFEADTVSQIASTQGKPKKATFFVTRRIEDLTI